MADEVTITTQENGPYLVRRPVRIFDADGNEFHVEQQVAALCRRGGSTP